MKHFSILFVLLAIVTFVSCDNKGEKFVVKGTTSQSRLNGERVFLVPFGGKNVEDSIGVDSVVVKDNKFEFTGHGEYMARITMDKRVRYGTQDLLIVTEAGGEVKVVLDSISHGGGTPQNEALEQWKNLKTMHDQIAGPQVVRLVNMRRDGDSISAKALADSLEVFNKQYLEQVHAITKVLGKGTLYDFLTGRYGK